MLILALETATSHQSVAVLDDQHLLGFLEYEPRQSLTPQIIPAIDCLLTSVSLRMADLEGLAVSIGPGTFTGLRVGLSTMTGFRLALNIPLVGVSTLEGLVWNQPPTDRCVLSTIGIRSGMAYWGLFSWMDEHVICLKEGQTGDIAKICAAVSEPTALMGEGWRQKWTSFPYNEFPLIHIPPPAVGPSAKGIGLAGERLLAKGVNLPEGSTPDYIQPCYAERAKS
jgi:tRNA threonylcarbamoyladenosine biosynthesis protein TsaB